MRLRRHAGTMLADGTHASRASDRAPREARARPPSRPRRRPLAMPRATQRGADSPPTPAARRCAGPLVRRGRRRRRRAPSLLVARRRDPRLDRRPRCSSSGVIGRGRRAGPRARRGAGRRAPARSRARTVAWLAIGLSLGAVVVADGRDVALRPERGRHARPARLPAGRRSGRSSRREALLAAADRVRGARAPARSSADAGRSRAADQPTEPRHHLPAPDGGRLPGDRPRHRRLVGRPEHLDMLLPRLWLQHFTGHLVAGRDGRTAGSPASSSASSRRTTPTSAYCHMIATNPNLRRRGLGRGAVRALLRGRPGRRPDAGQGDDLARQPRLAGVPPVDRLRDRRGSGEPESLWNARPGRVRFRPGGSGHPGPTRSDRRDRWAGSCCGSGSSAPSPAAPGSSGLHQRQRRRPGGRRLLRRAERRSETVEDVPHHPCTDAHTAEVFFVGGLPRLRRPTPSDDGVRCLHRRRTARRPSTPTPASTSTAGRGRTEYDIGLFYPLEEGWDGGDHEDHLLRRPRRRGADDRVDQEVLGEALSRASRPRTACRGG